MVSSQSRKAPGSYQEYHHIDGNRRRRSRGQQGRRGRSAPPARLREYFPETLLWQPALITDEQGGPTLQRDLRRLHHDLATHRASASSRSGSLGGVTAPLRVFQDFFVDLDLPVALTQNDEVSFPVAVYNYLKSRKP